MKPNNTDLGRHLRGAAAWLSYSRVGESVKALSSPSPLTKTLVREKKVGIKIPHENPLSI